MAKKQAAASSKTKAATNSKAKAAKPVEASAAPKGAATKKPAAPALSTELIGETAGNAWQALSERGDQSVASLKKSIDAPDDLVLLALGWLAREDKLAFQSSGRTVTVSLR